MTGSLKLPAYSGIPRQGNDIVHFSTVASAIFPLAPEGAPKLFSVRVECPATGESAVLTDAVALLPPYACSQTYALRSAYPPSDATGPRAIEEEDSP